MIARKEMQMASALKDETLVMPTVETRKVGESRDHDPVLFGAVYYRRTAPPRTDWERDYKRAVADGHRTFRHWFTWNAISRGPGEFEWEPYDEQLDLAAKYGIRTVIAEFIQDAPEWLYRDHPEARWVTIDGVPRSSEYHRACATGGLRSMCLDHPVVEQHAEEFLRALATRYKDHPGLYGYDLFNEYSLHRTSFRCYSDATRDRFVEWLKEKYRSIDELRETWFRYSLRSWDDIEIPRQEESYPDFYDFLDFTNDNAERSLQWRKRIVEECDPNHLIIVHGEGNAQNDIAPVAADDWRAARNVEVYGYSHGIMSENADALMVGDVVRAASRGKEFWHAESPGFGTWTNRSPKIPPKVNVDRPSIPEEIRIDCLMSLAAGARGYINPRWRPLLDGPFFEAFGWYGRDGSPTPRSEMVSDLAKWANDPAIADLWEARPVRGQIGLLIVEEAQAFGYATFGDEGTTGGSTSVYAKCWAGAYDAFRDSSIQADAVRLPNIGEYPMLYVPFPVALTDSTIETITAYAHAGGTVVFEGCPGYMSSHGHLEPTQPRAALADAVGWKETSSHLGPDRWNDLQVHTDRGTIKGAIYRQTYSAPAGEVIGSYDDGAAAIVSHAFGAGRVITVGTMPGYAYRTAPDEPTRRWFASLLTKTNAVPYVQVPFNTGITVRVHAGVDDVFLWILNRSHVDQRALVRLDPDLFDATTVEVRRGSNASLGEQGVVEADVPARDAAVIRVVGRGK